MKLSLLTCALGALALAACSATPEPAPAANQPIAGPATPAPAGSLGALADAVGNLARAEKHRVRDSHRHPTQTLEFFGLKPGMTVYEFSPGSGYYTEILSPFLAKTGGTYIASGKPIEALADTAVWGAQTYVPFGKDSGPIAPAGSVDMVVTFRNIHNLMWQDGMLDKSMTDFAAALKPGGVLGVVEHRADPRPEAVVNGRTAGDGYVSRATVIAAATRAGLVLEAESEINANPKDTKDHPFGVWTLPPNSMTAPRGGGAAPEGFNPETYKAIGESDRMTLRFRKPA